jgi:hypothetical protein
MKYRQFFLICANKLHEYGEPAALCLVSFMRPSQDLSHCTIDFCSAPNYVGVVMEKERSRDSRQRKGQMAKFVGP